MKPLLLTILLVFALAHAVDAAETKPNIIFILADDLGIGNVGCYGADNYKTPHIDALASGGIRYTRAYTAPLCGPSRVLIMTGRYAFRTGATNQDRVGLLKPAVETMLPKLLKPAGYVSSAVGKWSQLPLQPSDWGFDDYLRFNGSGVYWNKKAKGEPYVVNGESKTLRELGRSGELLRPEVLQAQTTRLLDDARSAGFTKPFTQQWLGLDRLDFFQFNRRLFPQFDAATEVSARQEMHETIAHVVRQSTPLSDLLKADYVVINSVLADYYGLQGVTGDEFRKMPVPKDSPRGGLIGMAAILAMGGNGEYTSPVERGVWVLRKLVNDPPPPAPANVPAIGRLSEQVLDTRQRILAHQDEPQCASCHRKIDPIGFGLENFNAVGQWRTEDTYQVMLGGRPVNGKRKTWTIDPSGALYKGPEFKDYFELRDIIATKSTPFARGFSAALIEYALGRPCGFSDEPLIDEMMKRAGGKKLAAREFIHALVDSTAFQTK